MKLNTVRLKVTGTYYYKGVELYNQGHLRRGSQIALKPEQHNPHDKNAVGVFYSGQKIGHLTRDMAAKYQPMILQGMVNGSTVDDCSLNENGSALNILLRVTYRNVGRPDSRCAVCADLPASPGVYELCFSGIPYYVGSSVNLQKRCYEHVRHLRGFSHTNNELQSLFNKFGEQNLEFRIVRNVNDLSRAQMIEGEHIVRLLDKGIKLVNKTIDGKGAPSGSNFGEAIHVTRDYGGKLHKKRVPESFLADDPVKFSVNPRQIQEQAPFNWMRLVVALGAMVLLFLMFAQ